MLTSASYPVLITVSTDFQHTSLNLSSVQHVAWVPAHTSTQPRSFSDSPPPRGGVLSADLLLLLGLLQRRATQRLEGRWAQPCFVLLILTHTHMRTPSQLQTHATAWTDVHSLHTHQDKHVSKPQINDQINTWTCVHKDFKMSRWHGHTHTDICGTSWHLNGLHWQKSRSPWHKKHARKVDTHTHDLFQFYPKRLLLDMEI